MNYSVTTTERVGTIGAPRRLPGAWINVRYWNPQNGQPMPHRVETCRRPRIASNGWQADEKSTNNDPR